ncbi:Hypothetical predicted protein [Prunus dulcis]|uniref:Uncharacterized protein n=1 Tax=Prunus dulcis TaxID=3755 RepID=A0A5E4G8K4_PRUDU|nr:Hypothetical predicted protein [Prunus dulcis]
MASFLGNSGRAALCRREGLIWSTSFNGGLLSGGIPVKVLHYHWPGTPPQKEVERSKTGEVAPPLPPVSSLFPANFGHLCPRSILQKVDLVLLYRSLRRPDPGKVI